MQAVLGSETINTGNKNIHELSIESTGDKRHDNYMSFNTTERWQKVYKKQKMNT